MSSYVDDNSEEGILSTIVLGEKGVLLPNVMSFLFLDCPSKKGKEQVNSVLKFEDLVESGATKVSED